MFSETFLNSQNFDYQIYVLNNNFIDQFIQLNIMIQTDHQQLEEADFPAFPVVFQQQFQSEFEVQNNQSHLPFQNTQFAIPQQQIKSLLDLTHITHQTSKYAHLFNQKLEDKPYFIQNFLKQYSPLDSQFVSQMKTIISKLHIIRLSQYKFYIGQFKKEEQCTGKGILIFKNGSIYQGNFERNKRVGKGSYVQSSIGWYKGSFMNDLKHGEGIEIFYKKSAYKGNFYNGYRHQKGLYVDWQGNVYNGSWKLGIMHGKGTLKTAASIYFGMFINWLKHGQGQQKFQNGDNFKGEYQNGRFDGNGTYYWKESTAMYEGTFKNGLRHGKGKWSEGSTKYNGSYSQGLKQGYGQLYFPSGNFYKGNFIQDKREGYGQMFWNDGSFYKGEWRNGIQNGKGQIYMIGGEIVSGLFQNSILVQILPSIYQKQQISNVGINQMFGSPRQRMDFSATKQRTFSQTKSLNPRKRLMKIDQSTSRKTHNNTQYIKSKMYFKSPQKLSHSKQHGKQCKCVRRLENFRLRQKKKTHQLNQSGLRAYNQY